MHRREPRPRLPASACTLLLAVTLAGCGSSPILPPPVTTSSGLPEWQLGPESLALYDYAGTRRGRYLSLRYSTDLPHPLGETFVSDLAIVIKDPHPGTYELPDDSVQARLARPPEIANLRTGLIVATKGFVKLDEVGEGGFSGAAKLEFVDTLHDGARYLVIARFRPPSR